jgi:hypothetical protein
LALAVELAGGLGGAERELLRGQELLAALALPTMALTVLPPHAVAEFLKKKDLRGKVTFFLYLHSSTFRTSVTVSVSMKN